MFYESLPDLAEYYTALNIAGHVIAASGLASYLASRRPFADIMNQSNSFDDPREAEEVRQYANTAVEYIHDQQIGSVALLDGGARPFYVPLIEAWRSRYDAKTDRMPPIFFLNPKGFQPLELKVAWRGLGMLKSLIRGNGG